MIDIFIHKIKLHICDFFNKVMIINLDIAYLNRTTKAIQKFINFLVIRQIKSIYLKEININYE